MDYRIVVAIASVFLLLTHMAAYHLGGIKACDNIEKSIKAMRRYEEKEVEK